MVKTVTKKESLTKEKVGELYQAATAIEQKEEKVPLTHEQLLEALYFCWDGFERSNLNFFLIRNTAKQIKALSDLSGDGLTIGVRRMEWNGGQQRVFQAFMDHEKITLIYMPGDNLMFKYKEVPVYLNIYEENPCLEGLDTVFYGNETFLTPNPLSVFEEKYDKQV